MWKISFKKLINIDWKLSKFFHAGVLQWLRRSVILPPGGSNLPGKSQVESKSVLSKYLKITIFQVFRNSGKSKRNNKRLRLHWPKSVRWFGRTLIAIESGLSLRSFLMNQSRPIKAWSLLNNTLSYKVMKKQLNII